MPINPISKTKQNGDGTIEQQGQKLCEKVDDSTLQLSSNIEIEDDKVKIQPEKKEDELKSKLVKYNSKGKGKKKYDVMLIIFHLYLYQTVKMYHCFEIMTI